MLRRVPPRRDLPAAHLLSTSVTILTATWPEAAALLLALTLALLFKPWASLRAQGLQHPWL
ncbi:MAG: hypothetical protein RL722_1522, partial [Pseudomonadota bacterium]